MRRKLLRSLEIGWEDDDFVAVEKNRSTWDN